ncbi:hypothetical protein A6C57_01055 [Fibrella sp. ES10-3-2-2]|nr:hypothetical protein A6C57_01055 [Fibrella sp. ES10-3-2-2]
MSDNNAEQILITVDVDKQGAAKQVVALRRELEQLTAVRKALKDNLKAGIITEDEFTESMVEAEKKAVALRAEMGRQQATLKQQVAIQNAAAGSLNQMRAQVNLTTLEVAGLSEAERNYSKDGTALVDSLTDQIAALKSVEKGYGDNRREVGNYALANKQATGEVKVLTVANKSAGESLEDVEQRFGLFGGTIGSVREKLSGAKAGLQGMKLGLTGIKGAIAATGIGLLLLALGAIYGALTRTQAGMDKVSQVTAAAGAVFTVLINRGAKLAEALSNVFTAPAKAYQLFKETFYGVGEEIASVAAAASATEKASQKLREAERALRVDRANSRAEVEKLKKVSEDVFATEQARLGAADRAYSKEDGLLKRQINIQKQRIDLLKQQASLNGNLVDDLDKLADAEEQLGNLEEESTGKLTELQNKKNEIRISSAQNRIAAEIALEEEKLAYALSNEEKFVGGVAIIKENEYAIRRRLLQKQEAFELAAVVDGSAQAAAIQAKFRVEEARLDVQEADAINRRLIEIQLAGLDQRIVNLKEHSVKRLILEQQASELRQELEQQEIFRTVTNLEELNAKLKALDEKRNTDRKKTNEEITKEGLRLDNERIRTRLAKSEAGTKEELYAQLEAIENQRQAELVAAEGNAEEIIRINAEADRRIADARRQFFRAKVDEYTGYVLQATSAFSQLVDAEFQSQSRALEKQEKASLDNALLTADQRTAIEKNFQKKKADLELEAAKKRKKIATVENIINTAKAITVAVGAPFPLNIVQIALAAATGAAQQAVIESQQFARGGVPKEAKRRHYEGVVKGPGTPTSDSIPALLSRAESVMNANTTAKYYDELSAMNVDGGGVPFPGAKPVDDLNGVQLFMSQVRSQSAASVGTDYLNSASLLRQIDTLRAGTPAIDTADLAGMIKQGVAEALIEMPIPRLVVSDYESVAKRVKVIASAADV